MKTKIKIFSGTTASVGRTALSEILENEVNKFLADNNIGADSIIDIKLTSSIDHHSTEFVKIMVIYTQTD